MEETEQEKSEEIQRLPDPLFHKGKYERREIRDGGQEIQVQEDQRPGQEDQVLRSGKDLYQVRRHDFLLQVVREKDRENEVNKKYF